jgi:hypothetical protein
VPQTSEFALPRSNGILNEFIPFAVNIGANVADIRSWAANPVVQWGYPAGAELPSPEANRAWRQSSFIAAGVAQLVGEALAISMLDDGDLPTFVVRLREAIGNISTQAGGIPEPPSDGITYGRQVGIAGIMATRAHTVSIRAAGQGMWTPVLPLKGGSLTGPLLLSEHPTTTSPPLQAATRAYVDEALIGRIDGGLYPV